MTTSDESLNPDYPLPRLPFLQVITWWINSHIKLTFDLQVNTPQNKKTCESAKCSVSEVNLSGDVAQHGSLSYYTKIL